MSDTIAAIATPAGRGGVGIVRVSGPAVNDIARAVCGRLPDPRVAEVVVFRDASGEALDQGVALRFAAPRSYTGEDVLELQGHGGPVVLSGLLERVLALGARLARPGEFTQRAFLNDKLDLAQAEAVADLIDAGSAAAARAALRSLQGAFSDEVKVLTEALVELRVWVEAAIDFADEDIDFLADQALHARLERLHGRFDEVLRAAQQGRVLRDGMTVVIAGRPNAGKSTLLNALCGHDAAIVTDLPGTTRDVLREHLHLDGMPVHLVDTAGLRHAEEAAADPVETEGIRRARLEMARADRVLFVIDAVADPAAQSWLEERAVQPDAVPVTVFLNKSDALDATPTPTVAMLPGATTVLRGSARTGDGLDALRQHLKDCMGYDGAHAGTLSARVRHLEALGRARTHAEAAVALLVERRAGELVAEELRLAQRHLDDITGEFHADDLLGRIFGSFCIGK